MPRTAILTAGVLAFVLSLVVPANAQQEAAPMNLLFIHHSCGGQLFAAPGERVGGEAEAGARCLYVSHPNGGGLRDRLEALGLTVNQASYGSIVGEDTDICHWHRKFATQMDRILRTQRQDALLPEGQTNRIVCFKSCYPNNWFAARGTEPGDPDDCERTVANAKAAYRALLPLLAGQPDVLFVTFTAPPMIAYEPVGLKATIKSWFRDTGRGGELAREFNTWLVDREEGWLAGSELSNVVVFDYWDILTGEGDGDYLAYPVRRGDSHPSSEGNQRAADAFVPFLQAAVAGMGWALP
jgi:hypothetical protein